MEGLAFVAAVEERLRALALGGGEVIGGQAGDEEGVVILIVHLAGLTTSFRNWFPRQALPVRDARSRDARTPAMNKTAPRITASAESPSSHEAKLGPIASGAPGSG